MIELKVGLTRAAALSKREKLILRKRLTKVALQQLLEKFLTVLIRLLLSILQAPKLLTPITQPTAEVIPRLLVLTPHTEVLPMVWMSQQQAERMKEGFTET